MRHQTVILFDYCSTCMHAETRGSRLFFVLQVMPFLSIAITKYHDDQAVLPYHLPVLRHADWKCSLLQA